MIDLHNLPTDSPDNGMRLTLPAPEGVPAVTIPPPPVQVRLADLNGDRLVINDDEGRPLVTCRGDGTLKYGGRYDPDDAARRFWEALARACPGMVTDPSIT